MKIKVKIIEWNFASDGEASINKFLSSKLFLSTNDLIDIKYNSKNSAMIIYKENK